MFFVCRWILSRWRVLIFSKRHSALYQRADEETARMLNTLSGACSLRADRSILPYSANSSCSFTSDGGCWTREVSSMSWINSSALKVRDGPVRCAGELLDWPRQWWLSGWTLVDRRRLTMLSHRNEWWVHQEDVAFHRPSVSKGRNELSNSRFIRATINNNTICCITLTNFVHFHLEAATGVVHWQYVLEQLIPHSVLLNEQHNDN